MHSWMKKVGELRGEVVVYLEFWGEKGGDIPVGLLSDGMGSTRLTPIDNLDTT